MAGINKKNTAQGASGAGVSGSGSNSRSHRSRHSSSSANSAVWQWQDDIDEGVYHDFEEKVCHQLEAAYIGGKVGHVNVPHFGRRPKCVVDTCRMAMVESSSKSPAPRVWQVVRLIDGDGSGSSQPCWQWQYDQRGDRDAWGLYSPDCTTALEAAWLSRHPNPVLLYTINPHMPYEVDVVVGKQKNVHTFYSRAVRRLTSDTKTPFLLTQQPVQQRLVQHAGAGTSVVMHTVSAVHRAPQLGSEVHGQTSVTPSPTGRVGASSLPCSFAQAKHNIFTEVTTLHNSAVVKSGGIDQFIEPASAQDSVEVCPICLDELHVPSSFPGTASSLSATATDKFFTSSKGGASMQCLNSTGWPWSSSRTDFSGLNLASAARSAATAAYPGSSMGAAPAAEESASSAVISLVSCKHQLHRICLNALMEQSASAKQGACSSIKCPTCGRLYGVVTGTCPQGRMTSQLLFDSHLRGFEDCGVIQITYDIMSGIQGPEHPHPGRPFTAVGFPRLAYLPDNAKGRLVLRMLQVAFERRLVFTVGSSVTTGQADVVTWNEIHHKTSPEGPYGYPDAGYLDRVVGELEAFGIMASDYRA